MPSLADSEIIDLVSGTLNELGRAKFTQVATQLQDYEVMSKWLKKDRVMFDSGKGIQRNVMTKTGGAAKHNGMFEVDDVDLVSLMAQMSLGWVHAQTYWMFERREMLTNRGEALVYNIIKPRRAGAMIDLAQELEDKAWALPGASNTTDPKGIPYWVVKHASTGFYGGAPSGYTTVAGIDPSTVPGWKNYTALYTDVSKDDLIKKMRTGHRKTMWKSPVDIQDYESESYKNRRYYVNETTISAFEDVGESQNENLGRDVASMDNNIVFRKHPLVWIPKLDEDTTNPVYQIDLGTFHPVILKGDYLRESEPDKLPNQHNTFAVFVDISYNYMCLNRRRNAVYATSAS